MADLKTALGAAKKVATKVKAEKPKPDYEYHCFNDTRLVFGFVGPKFELVSRRLEPFELRTGKSDGLAVLYQLPDAARTTLPLGITALVGGTGAGKSTLIKHLGTLIPIERYLVVEPHDSSAETEVLYPYSEADDAMAVAVRASLVARKSEAQSAKLAVLDSIRAPVYEISGSAGSKGVIKAFFTRLTRVSSALAANGITILVTINPMEDNDTAFNDGFMKLLRASVPATIELKTQDTEGWRGTITVRDSDLPTNRKDLPFNVLVKPKAVQQEGAATSVYQLQAPSSPDLPLFSNVDLDKLTEE